MRRAACLLGAFAVVAAAGVSSAAGDEPVAGVFAPPFAEDPAFADRPPRTLEEAKRTPTAIHMAVMPDGRVLYWGDWGEFDGSSIPTDGARVLRPSRSRILDLRSGTPTWSTPGNHTGGPGPDEDLFCVDQRVLPDGRVLAVGGSLYRNDPVDLEGHGDAVGVAGTFEMYGSSATRWLDPRSPSPAWAGGDESRMGNARWYPSTVTLPDGRVLVASGVERVLYNVPPLDGARGTNVQQLEAFDPATDRWSAEPPSADVTLPLYPRLHVTHDGQVLYVGAGQMWNPRGDSPDEALWNLHKAFDPATHEWRTTGVGAFGARSDPLSVPLVLEPPYDRTRVLIAGGTLGVAPTAYLGTALSEVVTYRDGMTTSERTGDLARRRWFSPGVLLPNGEVLALAGGDRNSNVVFGTEQAVRAVEVFDPETEQWTTLASSRRDRTYHGSAVLLPDGRVLLGGHAPLPDLSGKNNEDSATAEAGHTANNLKDPSFEVFTPPYLDPARGPRPAIAHAAAAMRYGEEHPYAIEAGGAEVDRVVLVRLPSTTHVTDSDQRGIALAFERRGHRGLRVTPPPSEAVAPPGFYYLFVLNERGMPSKARIVQVGHEPTASGPAPAPFGT